MRVVAPSSEQEMIAVFLRGELGSTRFGTALRDALASAGAAERTLVAPDLADEQENILRRRLLEETRKYTSRRGLFAGFPDDVRWERVILDDGEVERLQTIAYDYWLELTGGTRLFADAARRIREGVTPFGVQNDGFLMFADALLAGARVHEPILVTAGGGAAIVVLEGHVRLTAYGLAPSARPRPLGALLGTSPLMREWSEY